MHADELQQLEQTVPAEPKAGAPRYVPHAYATWAEGRAALPWHPLVRIVDLIEGKQFVTCIYPQDDCSDLALDGRTFVVGSSDCFDKELSAAELADVLRRYDEEVGPFTPRR